MKYIVAILLVLTQMASHPPAGITAGKDFNTVTWMQIQAAINRKFKEE